MVLAARGCGGSFARYDPAAFKIPGKTRMSTKAPETIIVNRTRVACDGGEGALGHPRVYLEMGDETFVVCGYCDRRFVLSPEAIEARARGEAGAH
jgi:uncharacterized Zn-finger protein